MAIISGDTTIQNIATLVGPSAAGITQSSSGIVYKENNPAFWVDGHDDNGGTYSSWYSVRLNNGSHYNNSNGRFTAPVAGVYYFYFTMTGMDGSAPTYPTFLVNGGYAHNTGYHIDSGNGDDQQNCAIHMVKSLSVNDYVQLNIGRNGTGHYTTGIMFGGFLIG